eukprot:10703377-Ditylum_brightwellii.AAC.2
MGVEQDLQMGVAFLTTRVKKSDKDDWKKLRQMILYLNGTADLATTLSAIRLNIAKWWVDRSFATHPYMRGHTG